MRASRLVAKCDKARVSNQQQKSQKRGPTVEHQKHLQHRKRRHHHHCLLGEKKVARCGGGDGYVFARRRRVLNRVTKVNR